MSVRPALTDGRLRLAIPNKGRLAEPAIALLREAGYLFEADDRRLFAPTASSTWASRARIWSKSVGARSPNA